MNGDMLSAEPTNKTDIATNHFASRGIVDLASYRSVHYISSPEYLRQPGQTHLNCCKLLDISESIFNPMRSYASGERTRPRVQRVAPSRPASLANGYLDASALSAKPLPPDTPEWRPGTPCRTVWSECDYPARPQCRCRFWSGSTGQSPGGISRSPPAARIP